MVIVVFGPVGCGKSTVAERLAERLGAVVINSDVVRKGLFGVDPKRSMKAEYQKGIYSREVTDRVYRVMVERALELAKRGSTVVLDATFSSSRYREMLRDEAGRFGVPVAFFYIDTPEDEIKRRLEKRAREGGVSDADWGVYLKMKDSFDPPEGAHRVRGDRAPDDVALDILNILGKGGEDGV